MSFSQEIFDTLVGRLEVDAARAPRAYKARVVALGVMGYAYLLFGLGLLLGLLALIGWGFTYGRANFALFKVALPVLALLGLVAKALWVRLEPPAGTELPRGPETAALWAEVDAVRKALRGPRIHKLLVDDAFNACIVQLPRFGLLGPSRNYLVLGLPLMQAVSREHFRAVLAHEIGHLSGAHGKLGAWVYRVRRTWSQVHDALEQREGAGAAIFTRFFRWYAPFYSAYSFVLARTNEYEADRASAQVVGADVTAGALVAISMRGALLRERFWPSIHARAAEVPVPASPFAEMPSALQQGIEPPLGERWLGMALERRTDTADTHPSLSDRLASLGQSARMPGPLTSSAADELLGSSLPKLTAALDADWKEAVAAHWSEAHDTAREKKRRLAELEAAARESELSGNDAWERADLTEDLHGADPAIELLRALVEREPDHVSARFSLGRMLLARDDASGIAHLEVAMARDEKAVTPGSGMIAAYYARQKLDDEARTWMKRGEESARKLEEAHAERSVIRQSDPLEPHGLDDDALAALAAQLEVYPRVRAAWLVRKVMTHHPERPLFVIGVKLGSEPQEGADGELVRRIADELQIDADFFVVPLGRKNAKLTRRARAMAKAPFFERSRWWSRTRKAA